MSSSLVFRDLLLIGTYVDTLFVFSLADFAPILSLRTRDSILSMAVISTSHNLIVLGQAQGCVDVVTLQGDAQ